jgi:soluble cytochrome b562
MSCRIQPVRRQRDPSADDVERWAKIRSDAEAATEALLASAPTTTPEFLAFRAGFEEVAKRRRNDVAVALEAAITEDRLTGREIAAAMGDAYTKTTVARLNARRARGTQQVVGGNTAE